MVSVAAAGRAVVVIHHARGPLVTLVVHGLVITDNLLISKRKKLSDFTTL